ncbi:MAG TPA: nucleotidyltransferase domain-containing protein [Candidatus Acidoferrum sp.]|nr:nucleotidyltransferase domain-containing protein [Candidatus Acidoferrum sp.]
MLSTESKLTELVNRLKELAAANLHSVVLYGSSARGDFHQDHSDLNVLVILESLAATDLRRVSPAVKWWTIDQREPAPLFFTAEELARSSDVFAIELLDIREAHRVLYGKDPVTAINIPMNLHRVELEHELRTTQLKLRQHYLLAADKPHELISVLIKSSSSVVTLLRHVLIAYNESVPATRQEIVARTAAIAGADASALNAALQLRDSPATSHDIAGIYGSYLNAIGKVIAALDHLIPKHEWQRVAKTN